MLPNIVRVYPASRKRGNEDPNLGDIKKSLRVRFNDMPVLAARYERYTGDIPRIGTVAVGGKIEELDFRASLADMRAQETDGIAVWMLPTAMFYVHSNTMNFYSASEQAVILEHDKYAFFNRIFLRMGDYYDLPQIMKLLISGIEQQLVRRVIAIGCTISETPIWMDIPKNRIRRVETSDPPIT
jgi:hypothetical protein